MRILLIDDDPLMASAVRLDLEREGYDLESVLDSKKGLLLASRGTFDLILLDIKMPGLTGIELIKALRAGQVNTPVIMLTSLASADSKLRSFSEGADDYICKPFYFPELLARIKAVLKRSVTPSQKMTGYSLGTGFFDFRNYTLQIGEAALRCHKNEILILKLLASNPGTVFSREEIIHSVWGAGHFPTSRTIDNYIRKLRIKIGKCGFSDPEDILPSIYSIGYRLVIPAGE